MNRSVWLRMKSVLAIVNTGSGGSINGESDLSERLLTLGSIDLFIHLKISEFRFLIRDFYGCT
jgi:hypothetical protein